MPEMRVSAKCRPSAALRFTPYMKGRTRDVAELCHNSEIVTAHYRSPARSSPALLALHARVSSATRCKQQAACCLFFPLSAPFSSSFSLLLVYTRAARSSKQRSALLTTSYQPSLVPLFSSLLRPEPRSSGRTGTPCRRLKPQPRCLSRKC